jgi:hypothetical protein
MMSKEEINPNFMSNAIVFNKLFAVVTSDDM